MKLLRRLRLQTQLLLAATLALAATLLLVGSGAYIVLLYEHFHEDFAHKDVPLQLRVSQASGELSSLHLALVAQGESAARSREAVHEEAARLRDRWQAFMKTLKVPEGEAEGGFDPFAVAGPALAAYEGALLEALVTLERGENPGPAIGRAARAAVEVEREFAQVQTEINQHSTTDVAALRAALHDEAMPALVVAATVLLGSFLLLIAIVRRTGLLFSTLHAALSRLGEGDTGPIALPPSSSRESARIASSLESFRSTLLDLSALRAHLENEVRERTLRLTRLNTELADQVAELAAMQAELRLYKRVFDGVAEAIVITRLDGSIIEVNDAYVRITGYGREEVLGRNPSLASSGRHDASFYEAMWSTIREQGHWSGEVWDRRRDGEVYPKLLSIATVYDEQHVPTHYVGVFTDITALKAAEAQLENLAYFDHLTGLPNRRLLRDRIEHAIALAHRHGDSGAVFFLDLDKFKNVNDTLGHQVGDQLLIEVARRLRGCVRESDTVGRLAGDEFLVIAEDLTGSRDHAGLQAHAVAEKIVAALGHPYPIGDTVVHTSTSVGIALFGSHASNDADAVLNMADTAMYEAKKLGRGVIRFFDPEMHARQQALIVLETLVRDALHGDGFSLHLQPQVTSGGRVVGVEALIRLDDAEGRPVPPGRFIPVAEETALILEIERWVIGETCRILKSWEADPQLGPLTIAVNISGRHFSDARFEQNLLAILGEHGVAPAKLKLELTESVVVSELDKSILRMRRLQEWGFTLSMDDFGTGYSSLSYLRRLPFNQIKIDRSFVQSMLENRNDSFIVFSVLTLARMMEVEVIAEGVETREQLDALLAMGCGCFQGYLFSRPVPVPQCEALVRAGAGLSPDGEAGPSGREPEPAPQ